MERLFRVYIGRRQVDKQNLWQAPSADELGKPCLARIGSAEHTEKSWLFSRSSEVRSAYTKEPLEGQNWLFGQRWPTLHARLGGLSQLPSRNNAAHCLARLYLEVAKGQSFLRVVARYRAQPHKQLVA